MRNLESHMLTFYYFNKLGWTVGYDIAHKRVAADPCSTYTLVICPPNSDEPCYYSYHQSLIGLMISASESLVDNIQGSDTHAKKTLETL